MIANVTEQTTRTSWQSIDWRRQDRIVTNLRQRIYRASEAGDVRRARNLQKLMMQSKANRLLAVRRVTQLNQGRRSGNLCLIHNVCHKQVHAAHPDRSLRARRLLEPCAGPTGKHGAEGGTAPPSPR